jgi:MipA family protein
LTSLKAGALPKLLGLSLAASGLALPTAQAAGLRIGSVESITPTEISSPRAAAGAGIAGRRALRFDAFGRRFDLQLEATPGLGIGAAPAGVEALQGQMAGLSGSWARLTRIGDRWVGLVYDGREYFSVETAGSTAPFNDTARRLPPRMQVVYRLSDAHIEDASFAGDLMPIGATLDDAMGALAADFPALAAEVLPTRRLDVGVVLDAEEVARYGTEASSLAIARMNAVDGILSTQIGVRINVVGPPTELTQSSQPFTSAVPSTLLEQLRDYRTSTGAQQGTGLTHLFTGRNLDGSTVGIAYLKSLCSKTNAASLSEARQSAGLEALIAAHEIGHVFGAPHDAETGSACASTPNTFLMATQVNNTSTLSDCSLAQINPTVAAASCLAPVDSADAALGVPLQADIAVNQASTVAFAVRSNGNATVLGARVEVQLPNGVEAAGAGTTGGGSCTLMSGRIECTLGDLAPGVSRDVEMSLVAGATGNSQAAVRVSAQNDALPTNNVATLRLVSNPGADLAVSVSFEPTTRMVQQGETATARILVRNFGLSAATDAKLTVSTDAGLIAQAGTGSGLACTTASGVVTCSPASIAAGASVELVLPLVAAASTSGTQRLFLRVLSDALTDPQPGNNEATGSIAVTVPPPITPPIQPAQSGGGGGGGSLDLPLLGLLAAGAALATARRSRRLPGSLVVLIGSLVLAGAAPRANAKEQPLWEVGLGAGAIAFSDYRGADSSQVYPLPVPYVIYRGQYLRADREGLRGVLFDQPRASLQLSLNATTPVDSDDNEARSGMADLKPALEAGPSLDLHLWRNATESLQLDFRIPARASFTLEMDPRFIGWLLAPRLNLDIRDPLGFTGWNVGVLAGPLFADRRYHAYFYSVGAADATAQRPAYAASGGYSGSQVLLSTSRRFARTWFGAFVRYDRLDGATFIDSPLVRQRSAWSAGFGFARVFAQSATTVESGD